MTDLRKAAEMALEALLTCDVDYDYDENPYNTFDAEDVSEAVEALRQALAQPEQEPVAYLCENAVGYKYFRWKKPTSHYKPIALYTAPPSKPWVSLTDEEIVKILDFDNPTIRKFVYAIEAKLKEKNT